MYAADSFSVSLTSDRENYAPGQTVEVTVGLENIVSASGLYGLKGVLNYSEDVFEPITSTSDGATENLTLLNGWNSLVYNSANKTFEAHTISPTTNSKKVMKILLKVKEGAPLGKTTIMLSNLQSGNGEEEIYAGQATLSINIANIGDIPLSTASPTTKPTSLPTTKPTTLQTQAPTRIPTDSGDSSLPKTGIEDHITPLLFGALLISLISYIAYIRYREF